MKNSKHLKNNMSRTFIHDIILQKKIQMKRALDIIALVAWNCDEFITYNSQKEAFS